MLVILYFYGVESIFCEVLSEVPATNTTADNGQQAIINRLPYFLKKRRAHLC